MMSDRSASADLDATFFRWDAKRMRMRITIEIVDDNDQPQRPQIQPTEYTGPLATFVAQLEAEHCASEKAVVSYRTLSRDDGNKPDRFM
jgi:hypothetical protein